MNEVEKQAQQWIDESQYLKMRDLGVRLGVTSHVIGRLLTEIGLRENDKPTDKAYKEGLVRIEQSGDWPQFRWHERRIVPWLQSHLQQQEQVHKAQ